jgi:hypothetical protein
MFQTTNPNNSNNNNNKNDIIHNNYDIITYLRISRNIRPLIQRTQRCLVSYPQPDVVWDHLPSILIFHSMLEISHGFPLSFQGQNLSAHHPFVPNSLW